MKPFAEVEEASLEEGMLKQGNLVQPSTRPVNREMFYAHIDEPEFIDNLHIGLQAKKRLKALLPLGIVRLLKQM